MIVQTPTLEILENKRKELQNLNILNVALPEWLGVYDFKEPDKKKYFQKSKADARDFYLSYTKGRESQNKPIEFTYMQFREYTYILNALMAQYICETGKWIKVPYGMGYFGISKFKPRYYKPNYVWRVDENGKRVADIQLNNNTHTSGYVCKFSWDKSNAYLSDKGFFRHKSSAHLKKVLFKSIMNNNSIRLYIEMERSKEMLTKKKNLD